jgi:hypothetical protein
MQCFLGTWHDPIGLHIAISVADGRPCVFPTHTAESTLSACFHVAVTSYLVLVSCAYPVHARVVFGPRSLCGPVHVNASLCVLAIPVYQGVLLPLVEVVVPPDPAFILALVPWGSLVGCLTGWGGSPGLAAR